MRAVAKQTAAIQFDDANMAERALKDFAQMRSMQDLLDDDLKIRVGLMEKTWTNWAIIFFVQDLQMRTVDVNCPDAVTRRNSIAFLLLLSRR